MQTIDFDSMTPQKVEGPDITPFQHNRDVVSATVSGTDGVVGIMIRLPSEFEHRLHRHPMADQILIVLSGRAVAYGPSGELAVESGQALVIPKGEWHGLRTAEGIEGLNLFLRRQLDGGRRL